MKQFYLDSSKLTDGELADLLHELNDELNQRLRKYIGLKGQLESTTLRIRSYSTNEQHRLRGLR